MRDEFSRCHPMVNFLYFALVLGFSMFLMHPVFLGISLICAVCYSVYLNGRKAFRFQMVYLLPLLLLTAVLNPVFNHEGVTVLTYFRDGNPLTLESIFYGAAAAVMLITVICWFSCFNKIITSDKFIYLFGRVIPSISLLLSMVLRFVPRFGAQLRMVRDAQKCMGQEDSNKCLIRRVRHGIKIISIMTTWALENSIETADSMKSRGFGEAGRTAFSVFRLQKRDITVLGLLLACGLAMLAAAWSGALDFQYFPSVRGGKVCVWGVLGGAAYFVLCLLPLVLNLTEAILWKRMQSRI